MVKKWRDAFNLGAGELSTILRANELMAASRLLMIAERALAATEGLAVSGSITVLESGYRKKYVTDLRPAYQQLLRANIWIDPEKLNQSLEFWHRSLVEANDRAKLFVVAKRTGT